MQEFWLMFEPFLEKSNLFFFEKSDSHYPPENEAIHFCVGSTLSDDLVEEGGREISFSGVINLFLPPSTPPNAHTHTYTHTHTRTHALTFPSGVS
jgi:hypothetical protein